MKCRITKKRCKDVLDFGKMPLGNGFVNKRNFFKEEVFNLKVGFNENSVYFKLLKIQILKGFLTKTIHSLLQSPS